MVELALKSSAMHSVYPCLDPPAPGHSDPSLTTFSDVSWSDMSK
ncbi:hypothetical protein M5D96_010456, partial [Drosophila gunungcola]